MQNPVCLQCHVSGKVQGVWFRAGAQQQARQLGLTGWARNLPDGRVEVLVCGERKQVEAMIAWLWEGPELAKVTDVTSVEREWQAFDRFAIL